VTLLTDEASYVRKVGAATWPTALPSRVSSASPEKTCPPDRAVYLLEKAAENRIVPVEPAASVRRLMRNVLFFAHDAELVRLVFESVCAFVAAVRSFNFLFFPTSEFGN